MNDEIINVLIVEDDKDLQDVYFMILSSQGYRVELAGNGIEALNILKKFTPNIILLDYFMPLMDGRNFLENYDVDQYPDTSVIVTSNISEQTVLDEMIKLGAKKAVMKADLSPSNLIDLVTSEYYS